MSHDADASFEFLCCCCFKLLRTKVRNQGTKPPEIYRCPLQPRAHLSRTPVPLAQLRPQELFLTNKFVLSKIMQQN